MQNLTNRHRPRIFSRDFERRRELARRAILRALLDDARRRRQQREAARLARAPR